MGMLQRFESRLEQAVSGAFAKAFRSAVEPVELIAALQREVDSSARILSRNRRLVPNTFTIELSPVDHQKLQPYFPTLRGELVEMLREHADDQHYVFAGPVAIDFEQDDDLVTGRFLVRSAATAEVVPRGQPGAPPPTERAAPPPPAASAQVSPPAVREVTLEINGTRHPFSGATLVVGRGTEADLRIADPGVSRRQAEFRQSADGLSVVDLHSTNGTLVDGRKVDQARLREGTVVRVGSTDITVRVTERGAGQSTPGRG